MAGNAVFMVLYLARAITDFALDTWITLVAIAKFVLKTRIT